MSQTYRSPAKLNLFLRILHKRPDGFHELASLFQTIDLFDYLHFDLSPTDAFTISDDKLPVDQRNLVMKALTVFRSLTGIQTPVSIHLEKKIPFEAGLGGGSGNAATTLWALNELFGRPASLETLQTWGSRLGSDVAFFLSCGTAYCTGRGEQVQNVASLKPEQVWIVKPSEGLSTPLVYSKLRLEETMPRNPDHALANWLAGKGECFNDLEPPAFALLPALAQMKQNLQVQGHRQVLLAGSGTSLFCLGEGPRPHAGSYEVYQAKFVNRTADRWY